MYSAGKEGLCACVCTFKTLLYKTGNGLTRCWKLGTRGCLEYSFTSAFVWRHIYGYQIARMDDYFLLRANPKHPTYLFPAGQGPLEPVVRALEADAAQNGVPLVFDTVLPDGKAALEQMYPGKFTFACNRDGADYVYETQALATLKGKKLSAKRNHINRFLSDNPSWRYERISSENLDEVRRMNTVWCMKAGCSHGMEIGDEYCAVEAAIRCYDELHLSGGLIRVEDKVIAFSIGDPLNDNTFLGAF